MEQCVCVFVECYSPAVVEYSQYCFHCRSRSRGCAQADDEDSMDASDVTPTPDIDITPEMGEFCVCEQNEMFKFASHKNSLSMLHFS